MTKDCIISAHLSIRDGIDGWAASDRSPGNGDLFLDGYLAF